MFSVFGTLSLAAAAGDADKGQGTGPAAVERKKSRRVQFTPK